MQVASPTQYMNFLLMTVRLAKMTGPLKWSRAWEATEERFLLDSADKVGVG